MTPGEALARLEALASAEERQKLARYGIPDTHAMGVAMRDIIALGKEIGRDHALAQALWADGRYEARTLAAFAGDPAVLTGDEMEAWVAGFDSWAICDTVCFRLFDRSPLAWEKTAAWCASEVLYTRRAGLAMIWALSVHDKTADDTRFVDRLADIAAAARDPREHVWKAASMALRATGKRNTALRAAARDLARELAEAGTGPEAKVGRATLKDLAAR